MKSLPVVFQTNFLIFFSKPLLYLHFSAFILNTKLEFSSDKSNMIKCRIAFLQSTNTAEEPDMSN